MSQGRKLEADIVKYLQERGETKAATIFTEDVVEYLKKQYAWKRTSTQSLSHSVEPILKRLSEQTTTSMKSKKRKQTRAGENNNAISVDSGDDELELDPNVRLMEAKVRNVFTTITNFNYQNYLLLTLR